jgi:hypothetical protein
MTRMHVYQDSSRSPCLYQHLSAAPILYTQGSRHILARHILLLIRAQYAVPNNLYWPAAVVRLLYQHVVLGAPTGAGASSVCRFALDFAICAYSFVYIPGTQHLL